MEIEISSRAVLERISRILLSLSYVLAACLAFLLLFLMAAYTSHFIWDFVRGLLVLAGIQIGALLFAFAYCEVHKRDPKLKIRIGRKRSPEIPRATLRELP